MFLYMGRGAALAASIRNRRVQALMECSWACGAVSRHELGATPFPASTAMLAATCQEFCKRTASLLSRRSPRLRLVLSACAEACRQCSEACELDASDPVLHECALRCRDGERICLALAAQMKE